MNIKLNLEFEGIPQDVVNILEPHLSELLNSEIRTLEGKISALTAISNEGMLKYMDVEQLLRRDEQSEKESNPETAKPAKKKQPAHKRASAKKKTAAKPATKKPASSGGAKGASSRGQQSQIYVTETDGRISRKAGAAGQPSKAFTDNVYEFMKAGDSDKVLMEKHNASPKLLERLRLKLKSDAQKDLILADTKSEEPKKKSELEQLREHLNDGDSLPQAANKMGVSFERVMELNKRV